MSLRCHLSVSDVQMISVVDTFINCPPQWCVESCPYIVISQVVMLCILTLSVESSQIFPNLIPQIACNWSNLRTSSLAPFVWSRSKVEQSCRSLNFPTIYLCTLSFFSDFDVEFLFVSDVQGMIVYLCLTDLWMMKYSCDLDLMYMYVCMKWWWMPLN